MSIPNAITLFSIILIFFVWARPTSSELASWVQALGSIAAIVVAAYFPIWHSNRSIELKRKSLAEILRVISDDATESLHLLANLFYCPERERQEMMRYEMFHRGRAWQALTDQLAQIPVAELTPQLARDLSYVKDAVDFGAFVAAKIPEWMKMGGSSRPDVVRVLRSKRDLVGLIRSRLPVPPGILSAELTQTQLATQVYEMKRPPCEPLLVEDAEIYWRYVWDDYRWSLPNRVYIHGIYPYLNDFGPSMIELSPMLGGIQEIEEFVKGYCSVLHKEHLQAEDLRIASEAL
ncbi:hypothetical protein [Pseudomonas sp. EZ-C24]|uniref:hypothetical protein n=1 Tax=Pseudomonas sp. EZ-C24 TaxID=2753617 RepID=UPI00165E25ED|nr:hypothetical protein [Pseudomonas sp. EZ-C24]